MRSGRTESASHSRIRTVLRRIRSVPSSPRPRASARTGGDGANSQRGPIPPLAAVAEVAVAVPECEVRVSWGEEERQALLGPRSGAVPDRELPSARGRAGSCPLPGAVPSLEQTSELAFPAFLGWAGFSTPVCVCVRARSVAGRSCGQKVNRSSLLCLRDGIKEKNLVFDLGILN